MSTKQTLNRNQWSAKEEAILDIMLDKYEGFVLEYAFQKTAAKLSRSLSAVRQHYYYHRKKIDINSSKKQFISLLKKQNYKLTRVSNVYIVEV